MRKSKKKFHNFPLTLISKCRKWHLRGTEAACPRTSLEAHVCNNHGHGYCGPKTAFLKQISSPYCALSRVCLRLLFCSCKTSQNVAFRIYLRDVNSKFHVNRHYRCEALCFIFSDISLDENLYSCKNQ